MSISDKTASLLKLAENLSDSSLIEEEEASDVSLGVTNLKNDVNKVKIQNEETNKILALYKARNQIDDAAPESFNGNTTLQERIDEIQDQMKRLEEEKKALENEKFSSFVGVSSFITQSSAPSTPQRETPIKSILKNPKRPQINASKVSDNFASFSDIISSPIRANNDEIMSLYEQERKEKECICAQFKAFISYVSEQYGELQPYNIITQSLNEMQDSTGKNNANLRKIEGALSQLGRTKASFRDEQEDKIKILNSCCQKIASSVFDACEIYDYNIPDIAQNPEKASDLASIIDKLLKKKKITKKERDLSKQTKDTVKEVTDLMHSIEERLNSSHKRLLHK